MMMNVSVYLLLALVSFISFSGVGWARSLETIQKAHTIILSQINQFREGQLGGDKEQQRAALIRQGWDLAGEMSCTYLDSHPSATAEELHSCLAQLNQGFPKHEPGKDNWLEFSSDTLQIAPGTFLVEASYLSDMDGAGTFFVVQKAERGFKVAWKLLDLAEAHFQSRDEIGRWAYLVQGSYGDGPLTGWPHLLPADSLGHPRFYINAWSVGWGGTRLWQLSVWKWSEGHAAPLLIDSYPFHRDDEILDRVDGEYILVKTKEDCRTFFSCGMCSQPEGVWRVRITPEGVQDLGRSFSEPNYQLIDELFYRLARGEDATAVASGPVIARLKSMISPQPGEDRPIVFGMLGGGVTKQKGKREFFDISFDDAHFRFTIEHRQGKPFVQAVEILE